MFAINVSIRNTDHIILTRIHSCLGIFMSKIEFKKEPIPLTDTSHNMLTFSNGFKGWKTIFFHLKLFGLEWFKLYLKSIVFIRITF